MNIMATKIAFYIVIIWSIAGIIAFYFTNGREKFKKLFQSNDFQDSFPKIKIYSVAYGPIIYIVIANAYIICLTIQRVKNLKLAYTNRKNNRGRNYNGKIR